MNAPPSGSATTLILQLSGGDARAADALVPIIYDELRRLARGFMRRERDDHTLSTTALVHEVYLRLVDHERVSPKDRAHFLAVAAIGMRRILVEHARKRSAQRRGGARERVSLSAISVAVDDSADAVLALHEALEQLAHVSPRLVRVVECRYFLGLTDTETAESLGVTERTVRRDWIKAKGWLAASMSEKSA